MRINKFCNLIDERKNELFELLCGLIRVNSENFSSHGNEENMSRYIASLCQNLDLDTDMFSPLELKNFTNHIDYMAGRKLEKRYNVVTKWRGQEDSDELMLMAHEDTVEIGNIENWKVDPLAGVIKDGKIYNFSESLQMRDRPEI